MLLLVLFLSLGIIIAADAFVSPLEPSRNPIGLKAAKENKAMEFLRKIGKVGNNQDFTNAIGVDEGPSGIAKGGKLKKADVAIRPCVESGIIDDLKEQFPSTSCGTQWSGYTDQVMGGVSMAHLTREIFDGRISNVLRGVVKMDNNGGFIQMATNLKRDGTSVDASNYDGLELLVQNGAEEAESFNVHIKTTDCLRPFSSYRKAFEARPRVWEKIRLPFSDFQAIGKPMEVELAIAGVRLYRVSEKGAGAFQP